MIITKASRKKKALANTGKNKFGYLRQNYEFYLFLIPAFLILLFFQILPIRMISIAFVDFKAVRSLEGSEWIGVENFSKMIYSPEFFRVLRNTLVINLMKIAFVVPMPMFLAVMLNEIRYPWLKKAVQTSVYIPHFFTWVVVYSVFYIVFGSRGIVNTIINLIGGDTILFFMHGGWVRFLLILSQAWWYVGWGTIVYLAAIASIDPEIYQAAIVDGADRIKQIRYITMPVLIPVLVLMVTINLGNVLMAGRDQVLAFYNSTVYDSVDIIETFVYRTGVGQANFSYAAAVGLFNTVIGFVLVALANFISKITTNKTAW
jgi:putative aldouronate transport system permease protein